MSRKIQLIGLVALTLVSFGCNSDPAPTTPEQKKAFMGGPPPAGYMDHVKKTGPMPGAGGGPPAGAPAPGATTGN